MRRREPLGVSERSFLRRVDPRAKLALSFVASAAAMLPLGPLAVFCALYLAFVVAARLEGPLLEQLRRMAVFLAVLFAVDWFAAGIPFALLVTLRLLLLVTAFGVVFLTTTADELRAALERLGVPARFAFVFATAYSSLDLLEAEWRSVVEAQKARGLLGAERDRPWRERLATAVPLVVPIVVLVTRRAWSLHEAAATRGLESPLRRPWRAPRMGALDYSLLGASAVLLAALFGYR